MLIRDRYRNWQLKRHVKKFGTKNNGYFNYFNRAWFEEHQATLIFLLNHWLLKYWFRWILRIHKDCKFDEVIDKIEPHTYRIALGNNTYRSDFRTHQKFSKRIYYAFRPYWYLLHSLDFVIQRTVNPDFSFGFDTLTVYPDTNTGLTTCDSSMASLYDGAWSAARSRASCDTSSTTTTFSYVAGTYWAGPGPGLQEANRGIFTFDTSIIGVGGIISDAIFSIYPSTVTYDVGYANHHINISTCTPTTNSNITISDWAISHYGSLQLSTSITEQGWTAGYKDFAFNDLTAVTKGGITGLATRNQGDITNAGVEQLLYAGCQYRAYFADNTGTTYDPKLVVTYTLPATGNKFQMVV